MGPPPLFQVRNLSWTKPGDKAPYLSEINLALNPGDIIALTGASGSGTPIAYGIPKYRTKVLYIPQRPALLPSTPTDFLNKVLALSSRQAIAGADDPEESVNSAQYIASQWNIGRELWYREWATLSGGEGQRIALAIGLSLQGTETLLLDEPTSALDQASAELVERYVMELPSSDYSSIKAIIWITHSEDQAKKVATRRIRIENGKATEIV